MTANLADHVTSGPQPRPRWNPGAAACWFPLTLAASAGLGALAVALQAYFSPVLLFPLLLGIVWGAVLVATLRVCQLAHRPSIWAGLIAGIALLVVTEHYVSYRQAVRAGEERQGQLAKAVMAFPDLAQQAQAVPPDSLASFLREEAQRGRPVMGHLLRGPAAWASWAADALLTLLAAAAVVALALRRPYCGECRSWYRTTRAGRLKPDLVPRMADAAKLPELPAPAQVEYRLWQCRTGCGPTQLELFWQSAGVGTARVWLDVAGRNQVIAWLDEGPA